MITRTTLILAFFAIMLLAGCVSAPEQMSPDECLIIVMSETINKENLPEGRVFKFELSGDYQPVTITRKFTVIRIYEPAVKIKGITSWVKNRFTGDKASDDLDILLPYKPGELVIADFVFIKKLVKTDEQTITSSLDFRKITSEEKEKLFGYLRTTKGYSEWLP